MNHYDLQFEIDPTSPDIEAELLNNGCMVSLIAGLTSVQLERTGADAVAAAMDAATWLVDRGVRVKRLQLDLVNQAGIAEHAGVTRSAVSQWITDPERVNTKFPRPYTLTSAGALWAWGEVNEWLRRNKPTRCDGFCVPLPEDVERFNVKWREQASSIHVSAAASVPVPFDVAVRFSEVVGVLTGAPR